MIRRIPKELIGDWKKYLVVFLFLVLTIGFVSGMYVANESMITSANEGVTKYKQEDGHFELKNRQMPPCFRQLRPVKKRILRQQRQHCMKTFSEMRKKIIITTGKGWNDSRICKDKGYQPGMYAAGKFSTEGG